jgi:hypothetical protein
MATIAKVRSVISGLKIGTRSLHMHRQEVGTGVELQGKESNEFK